MEWWWVGADAGSHPFALFAADLFLPLLRRGPQKDGGTENDWSAWCLPKDRLASPTKHCPSATVDLPPRLLSINFNLTLTHLPARRQLPVTRCRDTSITTLTLLLQAVFHYFIQLSITSLCDLHSRLDTDSAIVPKAPSLPKATFTGRTRATEHTRPGSQSSHSTPRDLTTDLISPGIRPKATVHCCDI